MSGGKKFIYLPRISIEKENLKSKPNKFGLKKAYFALIQAVVSKMLRLF